MADVIEAPTGKPAETQGETADHGARPKRNKREKRPFFTPNDISNLLWFWHNYLKAKAPWLLGIILMLAAQGFVYKQFLTLTETGLRVIFDNSDLQQLVWVCVMVFCLFIMRGVLSYIVPRISVWVAADAVAKLRRDLVNHLMTLDLAYFDRSKTADIILRLVNQSDGMSAFVGTMTVNALRDAITVVIIAGYLIYKSWLLFLATAIFIPVVILVMRLVAGRIKDIQASAENAFGDYINTIEEMSNGMRTVKISGQEDREKERLLRSTTGIRRLTIKLQSAQAIIAPTVDIVAAFAYVLVIGGGGYMVINGNFGMDSAGIITFLLGLTLLFDPARRFGSFFAMLQASLIILDSLRSITRLVPEIVDSPRAHSDFDPTGEIHFEDVTFGYGNGEPLFEGLNLSIPGGKTIAIVGATGSGKTTSLSLMTRLYEVQAGRVTIGGTDIREIRIKALRQCFSVVAQDIVIFNDSILENIRYVKPEATDAEIMQAAEAAEIADLIRQRGDLPLGPKGSQLSGGQKQRIGIARAILQDAPILLLDEATSALDQKTEDKVRVALERAAVGRTTVMIAHRLSTITHADWIYVMDFGKVVEEGTHAELLARDGLYAAMYDAQKAGYS